MLHLTFIALSIASWPMMMMPASDSFTLSARDEAFIHQITNGCKADFMTAEAALKRPLTDSERDYAKQVIGNHLVLLRVLGNIAKYRLVATADEVQADEQGRIVTASEVTDRDFNAFFLKGEIEKESAEIALCEVELRDGTDEDLKLFSKTYLPILRKNLVIAKEFASKY